MADRLDLTVVTPERELIHEEVDEVQVPGLGGYLGLLPGHAPLFSELGIGELSYARSGQTHSIALAMGFVEILGDEVRILADAAEPAADVDVERAAQAQARAEERIARGAAGLDYPRAQASLGRAVVRIQVAVASQKRS
ncbi:MAG: F0F1 ATP synthase subunit epsilon [bacterium]|nr:F0F1 ATP synthase subunit epsilon [bacterium]